MLLRLTVVIRHILCESARRSSPALCGPVPLPSKLPTCAFERALAFGALAVALAPHLNFATLRGASAFAIAIRRAFARNSWTILPQMAPTTASVALLGHARGVDLLTVIGLRGERIADVHWCWP